MPFPVRIVAYDPSWPRAFEVVAGEVRRALADLAGDVVAIEHVGSTAVPGLAAKPVIDVDVGVRALRAGEVYAERLEPLGLTWKRGAFEGRRHIYQRRTGADGIHGDDAASTSGAPRLPEAHVHVVAHDGPDWRRELAFRDLLRRDAGARAEYEALKRRLASDFPEDGERYAEAKTPFIRAAEERARKSFRDE